MAKHVKKRTVSHARKKSVPKGVIIGSSITAVVAVLAVVTILLLQNGVLDMAVSAVRSLFDGAESSSSEPLDPSSGAARSRMTSAGRKSRMNRSRKSPAISPIRMRCAACGWRRARII